jgi:hypothetical protein
MTRLDDADNCSSTETAWTLQQCWNDNAQQQMGGNPMALLGQEGAQKDYYYYYYNAQQQTNA